MICWDNDLVCKYGRHVRHSEELAMRLVEQHTSVPIPKIIFAFSFFKHEPNEGKIYMGLLPGFELTSKWDGVDDRNKERL